MTGYQSLLQRAGSFLEQADPGTVRLSLLPGVDLAANVGRFTRERQYEQAGSFWIEFGTIVIRPEVLTAAGVTSAPESGQSVVTQGQTYRIKAVTPVTAGYKLDCVRRY